METTKFTKGEWIKRNGDVDNYFEVIGPYFFNKTIACLPKRCFVNEKEAEANAKLIAQSPELLQVCIDLLSAFRHKEGDIKGNKARTDIFKYCPEFGELAVKARNAIEKATI